jgi:hypothetical protein
LFLGLQYHLKAFLRRANLPPWSGRAGESLLGGMMLTGCFLFSIFGFSVFSVRLN